MFFSFRRSQTGNMAIVASLVIPVVIGLIGGLIDYAHMYDRRSALQESADKAALSAATELRIAGATDSTIVAVARAAAQANYTGSDFLLEVNVEPNRKKVHVELATMADYLLPEAISPLERTIKVKAKAVVYGGAPTCLLSLAGDTPGAVEVQNSSINAQKCGVYVNSRSSSSLRITGGGTVKTADMCVAGGAETDGTVAPRPKVDCPPMKDPLAGRSEPPVGPCITEPVPGNGFVLLRPGTYCGGLHLQFGTIASMLPGVYVMKNGPLRIDNGAALKGEKVGFYLTGTNAVFEIGEGTTISLTAPDDGPLAGILFFESRQNKMSTFLLRSRNVPLAEGVFYLPKSRLIIGPSIKDSCLHTDFAASSIWTIIIAQTIRISGGISLTLNTKYGDATNIVPDGLGGAVQLLE